jgi:hypothetical protein
MATVTAAYPFIEVKIEPPPAAPPQRAPGVLAIVGEGAVNAGDAPANTPMELYSVGEAKIRFGLDGGSNLIPSDLYDSLALALAQDPQPSKVYGVKVANGDFAAALSALEGVDDLTFVALANQTTIGDAAGGGNPATGLHLLKDHVESMSADGAKRMGVAMVDPTTAKSSSYVDDVKNAVDSLRSDFGRMIMVAARGATTDVASAAAGAIAGYPPEASLVLKRLAGVTMPKEKQYSPSEIKGLSEAGINPVIDPTLIPGTSLHFADGRTFTTDERLLFIDVVRVLDDIDYRLKAGLIGLVGDARITKSGITLLKARTEGILGPLKQRAVIDDFQISIPVLDVLSQPRSAWTPTDVTTVTDARANRIVDMFLTVLLGPAAHKLKVDVVAAYA